MFYAEIAFIVSFEYGTILEKRLCSIYRKVRLYFTQNGNLNNCQRSELSKFIVKYDFSQDKHDQIKFDFSTNLKRIFSLVKEFNYCLAGKNYRQK